MVGGMYGLKLCVLYIASSKEDDRCADTAEDGRGSAVFEP